MIISIIFIIILYYFSIIIIVSIISCFYVQHNSFVKYKTLLLFGSYKILFK